MKIIALFSGNVYFLDELEPAEAHKETVELLKLNPYVSYADYDAVVRQNAQYFTLPDALYDPLYNTVCEFEFEDNDKRTLAFIDLYVRLNGTHI